MLACKPDAGGWIFFLCAYRVGAAYWLGNLYWVALVTMPGYVCFGLFQGLYWPVLAFAARYARRKNLPLVPAAAVLFVGAEACQSVLFTGFSWYFFAYSQYKNLHLIQIADIFGASGVSVLVAMANGLAAEIIIRQTGKNISSKRIAIQAAALACLLWAAVGYGHYRLSQSRQNIQPGPVVASIQPNVPSSVKEQNENAGQILEEMLALTKESLQSKPVLVVWPETIVLSVLNPAYVQLCDAESEPREFDRRISQAAKDNAYLLVGAHAAAVTEKDFRYIVSDKFNSAFLYKPDGVQDTKRYDKIHLVPFGEYIPFKKSAPWIYNLFMKLSPYDYDYNLTPGENYTLFAVKIEGREYRFGVLICYEDTDADLAGKMTLAGDKGEKTDWIVNISNDGWYVRFRNNKVIPTVELAQRTAISVFRCVENRISILKSVNTGISCLIDPVGKIQNDYLMGTLPRNAMERQGVAGWFADAIPIDGRISFFTRHGRWLDAILGFGLFILLAAGIIERKKHRREKK
jgi:apolipoprotein N-acyltransferase